MSETKSPDSKFAGRRIAVALSGGIACYKVATLVSRLVQGGAEVTALMTPDAERFLGQATLESLTGRPVVISPWESDAHHESPHVALARQTELMVIAPASANTIAKLAAGLCDNAVTLVATALPRQTPVLLAPAMNADMWASPIVQRNLETLTSLMGWHTVGPETGWQACRTQGAGRMSEPEAIAQAARQLLA